MKVGILTMHRVINYGSFMQAYALKRVIESLGHQCDFRDFRAGEPRHKGVKVAVPGVLDKLGKIPRLVTAPGQTLRRRAFRRELAECYERECWPRLGVSAEMNYDLGGDAIVIGSDEVFNYTQNHTIGYVPCLFGKGISAPKIITYAASAGYATWNDVEADGMVTELAEGLRGMSHISVRDQNTFDIVSRCIGVPPTMVIDPTLIYDFTGEVPKGKNAPPYILVYAYEGRMESEREIEAVRGFAERHKLRVVSAGAFHAWCDDNVAVDPFTLLAMFRDAAYVVTDTFHGSIFAMKFERQFATLVREQNTWGSNSNKVGYLLNQFGLQSRIAPDLDGLDDLLRTPIDYAQMAARHQMLQKESIAFLASALGRP
jgi:hypothetical protein